MVSGLVLACVLFLSSPNFRWETENRQSPYGSDFLQEWTGASMIHHGAADRLYLLEEFRQWQHDSSRIGFKWSPSEYFPPVYPPPYYWLLTPLAFVPYRFAVWIWMGLLFACWCVSIRLIEQFITGSRFAGRARPTWRISIRLIQQFFTFWFRKTIRPVASEILTTTERRVQESAPKPYTENPSAIIFWLLMLVFPATLIGITMGQKGPLWLLLWSGTWWLLRKDRHFSAGLIFGILSIKPTLFFLVPLLMLRYRQWRFLAGVISSSTAIWGLAYFFLPQLDWSGFLQIVSSAAEYQQHGGYKEFWSCNLTTLVAGLGLSNQVSLKWILVAPVYLTVIYIAIRPARFDSNDPKVVLTWMLATILLSPHFYFYDLVLLILPFRWLLLTERSTTILQISLLWCALLVSQLAFEKVGICLMPVVLFILLVRTSLQERFVAVALGRQIVLRTGQAPITS